jgi:hypothetical protein
MGKCREYDPEFKARVVPEAPQREKTAAHMSISMPTGGFEPPPVGFFALVAGGWLGLLT